LAWSIPVAGLITLGFAFVLLSTSVWGGGPIGAGTGELILSVALVFAVLTGIVGLALAFVLRIGRRVQFWSIGLSALAILLPICFLVLVLLRVTH
jgi:hypothetical protein